jgi:hypothetical protein
MTIRRHVDLAAIDTDYAHFLNGCETAPPGMFGRALDVRDRIIGYCVDEVVRTAGAAGLESCVSDGIREIEILMFDMLRTKNPLGEIAGAIAFGRDLEEAEDPEARERIIEALVRDRDFVAPERSAPE